MEFDNDDYFEICWKKVEKEIRELIRTCYEEYKEELKAEIIEGLKKEIILEYKLNIAEKLLKKISLSTEVIAQNVELPVEKVEDLKRKILNS